MKSPNNQTATQYISFKCVYTYNELGLKRFFIAKLSVVKIFLILINNKLTVVKKISPPLKYYVKGRLDFDKNLPF